MEKQTTLQTVERAISFLEFVAKAEEHPSVPEVAKSLNLNITTCYHLLRTLIARRYIKKDSAGRLELGDGIGVLFGNYQRTRSTDENLAEIVSKVASLTQETSFLSLIEGDKVVLKTLVEGFQQLRVAGLYVGLQGQEYRRAAGKAVLAHLKEPEKTEMLNASLAYLPEKDRKVIRKSLDIELPSVVTKGWAIEDLTEIGTTGIGSPVFDSSGSIMGSIGIVAPTSRVEKFRKDYLNIIMAAAAEATQLNKNIDRSE